MQAWQVKAAAEALEKVRKAQQIAERMRVMELDSIGIKHVDKQTDNGFTIGRGLSNGTGWLSDIPFESGLRAYLSTHMQQWFENQITEAKAEAKAAGVTDIE